MEERLEQVAKTLAGHEQSKVLWFSGGADSRLLLEIAEAQGINVDILRFDDGWSKEQKQFFDEIIREKNLKVFSYPPIRSEMFGNGTEELSLRSFYAIDPNNTVPIVRDIIQTEKPCLYDVNIEFARFAVAPIEWDVHIWGSRGDDTHYSVETVIDAEKWEVGGKTFIAPLFDWTREDVLQGLKILGVEYQEVDKSLNTGNITACVRCFDQSKTEVFCPKEEKQIPTVGLKTQGGTVNNLY